MDHRIGEVNEALGFYGESGQVGGIVLKIYLLRRAISFDGKLIRVWKRSKMRLMAKTDLYLINSKNLNLRGKRDKLLISMISQSVLIQVTAITLCAVNSNKELD